MEKSQVDVHEKANMYKDMVASLLNCGWADLTILEGSEYPMDELIEEYELEFRDSIALDVNVLVHIMFTKAFGEVQTAIDERLEEYSEGIMDGEILGEEYAELEPLVREGIDIVDYVDTYHNYLDTHVYFTQDEELFRKYFEEEIDIFEEKTGFSIFS